MTKIGEEIIYLEMESKPETNGNEVYDDVTVGSSYTTPTATRKVKEKQQPRCRECDLSSVKDRKTSKSCFTANCSCCGKCRNCYLQFDFNRGLY